MAVKGIIFPDGYSWTVQPEDFRQKLLARAIKMQEHLAKKSGHFSEICLPLKVFSALKEVVFVTYMFFCICLATIGAADNK